MNERQAKETSEPLKVLELFAGIGACSKALTNLNIDHIIVDAVEIDKYAIRSFNAIHGTNFEPQDIKEWDKDVDVDLIMHGSPCQDFSLAGHQAGGDKGSGTRSSLMYETLRIVEKLKPEIVIWENVRNLLSKNHYHNFEAYLNRMSELGYESVSRIMNAKDYGIPQNRERVFTISIRVRGFVPKHVKQFLLPYPQYLDKHLKDFLEKEVDEKYYLSLNQLVSFLYSSTISESKGNGFRFAPMEYDKAEIAHTITTRAGSRQTDNFIKIKTANKKGYDIATNGDGVDLQYPNSKTRRGRVGHGVSKTITTSGLMGVVDCYKIRKLTPLECWRLMGFDDEDFYKAKAIGTSDTQLYKQAGNSIVVNVLEAILSELIVS